MREIMILTGRTSFDDILSSDLDFFPYFMIAEENEWKTELIMMLLDERDSQGLDTEMTELLFNLCAS